MPDKKTNSTKPTLPTHSGRLIHSDNAPTPGYRPTPPPPKTTKKN